MKLSNLASIDPEFRKTGRKGLEGASEFDRAMWAEYHANLNELAREGEALLAQNDRSASHPSKCNRMAKCCAFQKAPPRARLQ